MTCFGSPAWRRRTSLDGNIGTGRIARIGDEDDLRLLGHGREDRVDIDAAILFLDDDWRRAGGHDLDLVDEEAMLGDDALVARRQIDMAEQAEQLVGTVAADQVCRRSGRARRRSPRAVPPPGHPDNAQGSPAAFWKASIAFGLAPIGVSFEESL